MEQLANKLKKWIEEHKIKLDFSWEAVKPKLI
mgnify:CR=1 FL=1